MNILFKYGVPLPRDAIVVLVANGATSIFSGFVIFSIIGYLAQELDLEVQHVVDEGVGLAFMVFIILRNVPLGNDHRIFKIS